jgi:hypothetical protein
MQGRTLWGRGYMSVVAHAGKRAYVWGGTCAGEWHHKEVHVLGGTYCVDVLRGEIYWGKEEGHIPSSLHTLTQIHAHAQTHAHVQTIPPHPLIYLITD